jgi:hypothetical protein
MTRSLRRLHLLLAVQSLLLILASVNRLWDATDVPVLPHDALRLVDVLASYGMHEATDYLHSRCAGDGAFCSIVAYQDDELSHFLFFAGFAGIAATLLAAQAAAPAVATTAKDRTFVLGNAALVAAAVVANLGFEEIGLDLYVVAAVAILAVVLLLRRGPRPLILYYASAYTVGLLVTAALIA